VQLDAHALDPQWAVADGGGPGTFVRGGGVAVAGEDALFVAGSLDLDPASDPQVRFRRPVSPRPMRLFLRLE
jgi:hypothetical protein